MVLSTANGGRYLTKRFHEMYAEAIIDPSRFTDEELEWLGIVRDDHNVSPNDDRIFLIDTQPIDPLTSPRKIDIRDIPGRR